MAALAVALTFSFAGAVHADDDEAEQLRRDRDRAERALSGRQSGELKPIVELMATVLAKYGGRIVESEFEDHNGRQLYEFYVLGKDGVIREVYVDPVTGEIVAAYKDD